MLLKIKGYKIIETINFGIQTVIYRARQEADEKPVLLKTHKNEYPTLAEIARLKQTYQLTKDLDIPEAFKCLKLENNGRGVALVFEDFGGISLSQYMAVNSLDLKDFFHIGIQLASGLGKLHSRQIVHKDIKPHNIIVNPATLEAKITDFSIASRLQRETAPLSHPLELEGTLAYMSPEQTGRMNRALDYRSDFYSLGVTFYEMLTGCLPFDSTDPLELVHAHIAKTPRPPRQQNPEVPEALSALTMKLLAKTAKYVRSRAPGKYLCPGQPTQFRS